MGACILHNNILAYFLGTPVKPFYATMECMCSGSSKWRSSWKSSASVGGRQLAASASTSPQSPPYQPQFTGANSRRQYTLKPVGVRGLFAKSQCHQMSRVGSRRAEQHLGTWLSVPWLQGHQLILALCGLGDWRQPLLAC